MISNRYANNGKSSLKINEIQAQMVKQINEKIKNKKYIFESVSCAICNNKDYTKLSEKDRYGLYMPVVICNKCGLIQTNPRMNLQSYNEFYDTEFRKLYLGKEKPTNEYFTKQFEHGERIYNYISHYMEKAPHNLNILEVGTGAGGILYYFQQNNNSVAGIDLGSEYINYGIEKYGLNLSTGTIYSLQLDKKPDIIIYSHVLEHILDPLKEIRTLKNICHKDTLIYIELPGIKNLSQSYKMDFLKYLQNAHVYHFTLTTLTNLFKEGGYDLLYGDEYIHAIFKPSPEHLSITYKNDCEDSLTYLKRLEYMRYLPTPYRVKEFFNSLLIDVLRITNTLDIAKKIKHKL
jgi:2-polyprenyl-3-methyl-5-hydroxy-6-metoxy-1,4-benzoquinol methylase